MKSTRLIMGMPIAVEIVDAADEADLEVVFQHFAVVDRRFSIYKKNSEISKINRGEIQESDYSDDMQCVFMLCEETKQQTQGYFDIVCNGQYDPSGLVKGWAIHNAADLLKKKGFKNFYIDAGGDIQVAGKNREGKTWRVGIRNPFNRHENIKILAIDEKGVATSGTYVRGQHIYNPHAEKDLRFKINDLRRIETDIVSLTVIGPNVYEADRFATAAFAMGERGIHFIESLKGFEGYMINKEGKATLTSGFERFVV